ncbi:MAG: nucleotidyl transferase AbiEii/AbiGii toxin family protein [Verrucomicrobiales bacterium]|nr:nucleotidyl transferase AbiEii/AbiGii toxin family protein [Verrucomicrobiales bacterium]
MKNPAASIRARLLNLSRKSGEPLDALMEQFATGRFLYRLANSSYRDRFVLKGAQLFRIWGAEQHRPTRDIDLLGYGDPSEDTIRSVFLELVQRPVEPADGLEWGEIKAAPIRDDIAYGGVRAVLEVRLAGARISLQIDVGFGDAIIPQAMEAEWQELLDLPSARLLIYPPETVVAEKLEAVVSLGLDNSRMKDFFDLYWLSHHQTFNGDLLIESVTATFERRSTGMPHEPPLALTEAFANDSGKTVQWKAFRRKGKLVAPELVEVVTDLSSFLEPVLFGEATGKIWIPESGWTGKS